MRSWSDAAAGAVVLVPALAVLLAAEQVRTPRLTGLDHIPIAVNDLERAADDYRALGFALKPGRPHANGIRNQHVKFTDGTELELITAPEARDGLTTTYRRHLAQGDGPAFLAFYTPSRPGAAPSPPAAPSYIFLGPRNLSPTDRPEHFAHANTAESFVSVWLAGRDLAAERALLAAGGAKLTARTVSVPDSVKATVAELQEGTVVLLPENRQVLRGRPIAGATLRVRDIATARRTIEGSGAGAKMVVVNGSVFLPPTVTHGLWIEFREQK